MAERSDWMVRSKWFLQGGCLVVWILLVGIAPQGPYFDDGYLGLSQDEIRNKLGPPDAVRTAKAAVRLYSYYPLEEWKATFKDLTSPEKGEDVYRFTRDGTTVQYSFVYMPDQDEDGDFPPLYVKRVEIDFSPPSPLRDLPALVPEFKPVRDKEAPAFRAGNWILLFKGPASSRAEFIVQEQGKERWDWLLAFQLISLRGLPNYLTLDTPIDRLEITAQSPDLIQVKQRYTHEAILNPFSKAFKERPAPTPQEKKPIPVPEYAE